MEKSLYTSSFRKNVMTFIFTVLMLWSLWLAVVYIGGVYSSVVNKNAVNEKSNKRFEDFYNLPKNSIDIAFVGSSHSYCSFDPEIFDYALGTSSFQLGMPLQHYDAAYYTVREIYNYQMPKLIVVEVYWDLLGKEVELKQALTLFDSLNNPELEKEYVNQVFTASQKLKYRLDILNYQKDYFTYRSKEMKERLTELLGISPTEDKQQGEEYYRSKGYVYCDYTMLPEEFGRTNQFNGFDGRTYEINEKQMKYLEMLVDLVRVNGGEVVFVTAPVANVSLTKMNNYELVNEKVSNMARSMGVEYIDYNMPSTRGTMFEDSNFRDDAHLNDSGVKILDVHFINWLKEIGVFNNLP